MLKIFIRVMIFLLVVVPVSYAASDVTIISSDYFVADKSNRYKIVVGNDLWDMVNLTLQRDIYENGEIIYQKSRSYYINGGITKTYHWVPYNSSEFLLCVSATSNNDFGTGNYQECKNISVEGIRQKENSAEGEYADNILNFSCDLDVKVTTKKYIYNSSEALGIKIIVDDLKYFGGNHPFTLAYWIEDLFGNVVKTRYENTYDMSLSEVRSYNPGAPKITDSEAYVIKAEVVDAGCIDDYDENNRNETMILVKGVVSNDTIDSGESLVKIMNIKPKETSFGDAVDVSIDVFRGDTAKYSLGVWIERPADGFDVSEKSVVHVKNKNMRSTLKIPVQIKPNCNGRYKDGTYEVIAEGLGIRDVVEIQLSGKTAAMCKTETKIVKKYVTKKDVNPEMKKEIIASEKTDKIQDVEYEIVSAPDNVSVGELFFMVVELINNLDSPVNVSLYSYAISGKSRLSEGLSTSGWVKSWTGNKKEIYIEKGDAVRVNLSNRIMKNITGNFTLKVKIIGDVNKVLEMPIMVSAEVPEERTFSFHCNRTDKKSYLFLVNGHRDDIRVVVSPYNRPQSKRDVVIKAEGKKKLTYFGIVDEFSVEYDGQYAECRPENNHVPDTDDEWNNDPLDESFFKEQSFIGRMINGILRRLGLQS